MAAKDMHRALNMGLLEPVGNSVKGESFQFRLTTSLIPSLRIHDLMYEKKSICKSFMIVLALMPFVLRISVKSLK
jgi:hypothetical protein